MSNIFGGIDLNARIKGLPRYACHYQKDIYNNITLLYLLIPISKVLRTYGLYGQSVMKTKTSVEQQCQDTKTL